MENLGYVRLNKVYSHVTSSGFIYIISAVSVYKRTVHGTIAGVMKCNAPRNLHAWTKDDFVPHTCVLFFILAICLCSHRLTVGHYKRYCSRWIWICTGLQSNFRSWILLRYMDVILFSMDLSTAQHTCFGTTPVTCKRRRTDFRQLMAGWHIQHLRPICWSWGFTWLLYQLLWSPEASRHHLCHRTFYRFSFQFLNEHTMHSPGVRGFNFHSYFPTQVLLSNIPHFSFNRWFVTTATILNHIEIAGSAMKHCQNLLSQWFHPLTLHVLRPPCYLHRAKNIPDIFFGR